MKNITWLLCLLFPALINAQHHHTNNNPEAQPLLAQVMRLKESLDFLGSSLSKHDEKRLDSLMHKAHNEHTIKTIQEILDPYCLAVININPEGRVKVDRGAAKAKLIQHGWTSFIVKVENLSGGTPPLKPESPNAKRPQHAPSFESKVKPENIITDGQVANRFMEILMYTNKPMLPNLSGLKLEYAVVQLYSSEAGKREIELGFNVGQGTQDIGFRNTIHILFDIKPAVKVKLNIKDDDGKPVMASLIFSDSIDRTPGKLAGVYPLPSRRVAAFDEYPDFFFQKQIYRNNGEHLLLAPGKYHLTYTRGPEYIAQTKEIEIPEGKDSIDLTVQLKRWINLSKLGWYSADHHVHAAGCSHYDSPEEGVRPQDMFRQMQGEDLNFAAVLTWGPSWYHQKQYFTGKDDLLSTKKNIMRYDVEVSGFPSSHSGHVVLLGIKEDDYPGTTKIEEWPSWTLPVLQWARKQGGLVGYAHSGWGLGPLQPTTDLPNYITPAMDFIGANEYIVTIAHNAIDFYSLGDTPPLLELNMWYHTLNAGFKPTISGETDYPCITDERLGQARSYFKSKAITYDNYLDAIKTGRSYVSDGKSHIMNFSVNNQEVGTKESFIKAKTKQKVTITADVTGYLQEQPTEFYKNLVKSKKSYEGYFWDLEWARIDSSRKIGVELIVNGYPVDTIAMTADGKINKIKFQHEMDRSSWVALRVYPSSHTNPIFIEVDGQPIKEKRSIEWCIKALDQCWKQKEPNMRAEEKEAARAAYDKARTTYVELLK